MTLQIVGPTHSRQLAVLEGCNPLLFILYPVLPGKSIVKTGPRIEREDAECLEVTDRIAVVHERGPQLIGIRCIGDDGFAAGHIFSNHERHPLAQVLCDRFVVVPQKQRFERGEQIDDLVRRVRNNRASGIQQQRVKQRFLISRFRTFRRQPIQLLQRLLKLRYLSICNAALEPQHGRPLWQATGGRCWLPARPNKKSWTRFRASRIVIWATNFGGNSGIMSNPMKIRGRGERI